MKDVKGHKELAQIMVSKWVSFVHELQPSNWPSYAKSAKNLVFNATDAKPVVYLEPDTYRTHGISIWDDNILEAYYNEKSASGGK